MSDESLSYQQKRKKASEFNSREQYLNHELTIMSFKKWRIHLPFKDYGIEIEDWVPAIAATIGKVVMVTAMVAVFAAQFGLSQEFVAENVRYELLIAGGLFVIVFSAFLNPNANLPGTHGPMIPLIPLIAAAGGHPLALGIMVGVFGLMLAYTKGGSKLVTLTGVGVRGGLLIYLGSVGLISQIAKTQKWAAAANQGYISFAVIGITVFIYAYLAKVNKRWLSIPLCSTVAGIVAITLGADFAFTTDPGLPHFSPTYWWGENTGWQMGWPNLTHFIAVIPFAILAVAMWSPDYLGHRVFQELNYPKMLKAF
ncbi:MAG: integral membrane protein [Candidatus Magnetoglobus multicellularis str. Araruama]|uniref:Integral membrane protein n=1 Tax=Candidatus Magnetoglobus multicellularis str. Araruama TaxID=890399 RepID=A0A1V1NZV7_9BACT|nr:MAG: integral membrane protein [Candidatus Magnetoglobus multicellularis str. Araruama]